MKSINLEKKHVYLILLVFITIGLFGCSNADKEADSSADKDNQSKQTTKRNKAFADVEDTYDVQIGVYAMDTGSGQTVEYHPKKRFAYSSTFKVLAAGVLLKQNEIHDLDKIIFYNKDDLVAHSPITEKHTETGMTLLEISEAAIRKSDNTAGNLLLQAIGGPDGFKQALRNMGDDITMPERYEVELNEFSPANKRDTSTPKMMAVNLKNIILTAFLPDEKSKLLFDWMQGNESGDPLIRKGAPKGWMTIDKSGAGTYGTRNDIAVVYPPNRKPVVIAIMSRQDKADAVFNDSAVAKAAKITLDSFK